MDRQAENLSADGALFWAAYRYISRDMNAAEEAEFEGQLAIDQLAREAVARVVELSAALRAADVYPASSETRASAPQLEAGGEESWAPRIFAPPVAGRTQTVALPTSGIQRAGGLWQPLGWMAVGAAACLALMAVWPGGRQHQLASGGLAGRSNSVGSRAVGNHSVAATSAEDLQLAMNWPKQAAWIDPDTNGDTGLGEFGRSEADGSALASGGFAEAASAESAADEWTNAEGETPADWQPPSWVTAAIDRAVVPAATGEPATGDPSAGRDEGRPATDPPVESPAN